MPSRARPAAIAPPEDRTTPRPGAPAGPGPPEGSRPPPRAGRPAAPQGGGGAGPPPRRGARGAGWPGRGAPPGPRPAGPARPPVSRGGALVAPPVLADLVRPPP